MQQQQQQEPVPLIGSPNLGDNFEFETFRSWQREKKLAGRKRKMVEAEASAVCKEDLCPLWVAKDL